jgi:hypothetical protein
MKDSLAQLFLRAPPAPLAVRKVLPHFPSRSGRLLFWFFWPAIQSLHHEHRDVKREKAQGQEISTNVFITRISIRIATPCISQTFLNFVGQCKHPHCGPTGRRVLDLRNQR